MPGVDSTQMLALPTWVAAVTIAFLVVVIVLAFLRRGLDHAGDAFLRIGIVLAVAFLGWVALDHLAGRDLAAERRAVDMRARSN